MGLSITAGARTKTAKMLCRFKISEETQDRLVLQAKRITALLAAAFVGIFGGIFAGVAGSHFYPPRDQDELWVLLIGGGLGVVLLALALMFLYFGLRRPDRIVLDARRREARFERRRDPLSLLFDLLAGVEVRTENRSRARERCIVHPVVLVTRDGGELEIDAASDIEEMIRLAAKLRGVTGLALSGPQLA